MHVCLCKYYQALPEHNSPLERRQLKSSHSQYGPQTFPKSLERQAHWPHTQSPRLLQAGVSGLGLHLSCWVGLYSPSEHSHREPSRPGSHRHMPHSKVPLPWWHKELAGSEDCWHVQSHAKSTVTSRVSLKPIVFIVKVRFFSLGQPWSFASMLNET